MKLKAQYETETYISQGGYFAIYQIDGLGEDATVILSRDQCRVLAKELQKAAKDDSWWCVEANEDE